MCNDALNSWEHGWIHGGIIGGQGPKDGVHACGYNSIIDWGPGAERWGALMWVLRGQGQKSGTPSPGHYWGSGSEKWGLFMGVRVRKLGSISHVPVPLVGLRSSNRVTCTVEIGGIEPHFKIFIFC